MTGIIRFWRLGELERELTGGPIKTRISGVAILCKVSYSIFFLFEYLFCFVARGLSILGWAWLGVVSVMMSVLVAAF